VRIEHSQMTFTNSAHVLLIALFFSASVATLGAQPARGAGFDVLLGAQHTTGGPVKESRGLLIDATAAISVRKLQSMPLLMAAGTSGVLANTDDSCRILPTGGCAPAGNFGIVHVNFGTARRVGTATVRALAGPARLVGGGHASTGLQVRVDGYEAAAAHFGLGAMMRVLYAPAHGNASYTMWALGVGAAFR
jgi:hypothetical protein